MDLCFYFMVHGVYMFAHCAFARDMIIMYLRLITKHNDNSERNRNRDAVMEICKMTPSPFATASVQ